MKTTPFFVITSLLVALTACSKQENIEATDQASKAGMPLIEKTTEAKPAVVKPTVVKPITKLPNEIDPADMSGNVEQDASGKKVLYWEDPMVPGRYFSKSGQSPFMDMKLSPKYAE